ncbi:DUF4870 domain-containing protein [Luteococcus peritonei]|uniref:DUF4870 domain-containing protein n=1 Tax=Luteococcus peritonei TaxID=88874 RepID=A0ABW4RW55_9ACTN
MSNQQFNPYQHPNPNQAWSYQPTPPSMIPNEDRSAAAMAHFSTIIAMVLSAGWLSFVGPLVIWLLYKDRSPYVRRASAGAFNFNIWLTLATIVGWILVFTVILAPVGGLIMLVTSVLQIWCHVRAGLKALKGEEYHYRHQTGILS